MEVISSERRKGLEAQRMNIAAAKTVAETIRTTLGPKGMDKMLVDPYGQVTVSNDGVTILKEMGIDHPSAKLVVDIAQSQENEVGDGTTSAVVLAGSLLEQAEKLLDKGIHPTIIVKGYRKALERGLEALEEMSVSIKPEEHFKKIAETAMTGKGAESDKEALSSIAIKALEKLISASDDFSRSDIKYAKKIGGKVGDSELVEGVVLAKERIHSSMPGRVSDAKIALLNSPVEVKETDTRASITIDSPEKMQGFLDIEREMLKGMVEKIASSGANVLFCMKGVDDEAAHLLSKKGITAFRRVSLSDLEYLSKSTGGRIVNSLEDLGKEDLGKAGIVESLRDSDGEPRVFVKECKSPKATTLIIHGGTDHVVTETKRAIEDAVGDMVSALKLKKAVAGAGSTEMELSARLKKFSKQLKGEEGEAALAFSEALKIIPLTLAESSGLEPGKVLEKLEEAHEKPSWAGIDVFKGEIIDAWEEGIIEPLKIKTQALGSAAEVAVMLLRIDDVIAAEKEKVPPNSQNPMFS